jgi:hypothetical protein
MKIKISSKWLNHKFLCSPEYIVNHCKGRCCWGANRLSISLLPEEDKEFQKTEKKCFYQCKTGLCSLHGTIKKPFGCIISPFTVNKNKTLIIRHRYSKFKCHGQGDYAYNVFKFSLVKLFGEKQYNKLKEDLENNVNEIYLELDEDIFNKLIYLDKLKQHAKKYFF